MIVGRFRHLFLIYLICGGAVGSVFLSEPTNVTILEGESTRINCTTTMKEDIVIWILNGLQYYWSDFNDLDVYTLDPFDNSLTVNSAPRTLDNTSFQCVVNNRHLSAKGYLTVLYTVSSTSTIPMTPTTTLSRSSTGISRTSYSSLTVCASPGITAPTSVYKSLDHLTVAIVSSVGAFVLFVVCCCCMVFCLVLRVRKSKSGHHSAVAENFNMVRNQVYDKVSIKLTRNSAYSPNHFSRVHRS